MVEMTRTTVTMVVMMEARFGEYGLARARRNQAEEPKKEEAEIKGGFVRALHTRTLVGGWSRLILILSIPTFRPSYFSNSSILFERDAHTNDHKLRVLMIYVLLYLLASTLDDL